MCHYINVAIGLLIRIELRVQLGSCSDAGRVDRQDIEKSRPRKYIRESNRRDAFGLPSRTIVKSDYVPLLILRADYIEVHEKYQMERGRRKALYKVRPGSLDSDLFRAICKRHSETSRPLLATDHAPKSALSTQRFSQGRPLCFTTVQPAVASLSPLEPAVQRCCSSLGGCSASDLAVRVVPGAQLREDPESPAVQYPLASS